jgi:hypothetical protein
MLKPEVIRRLIPLILVLVGACTGVRPAPTSPPPVSATPSQSAGQASRLSTALDLEVGPSEYVGSFRASGTLTDQTGRPVAGAAIRVELTPLEGRGTLESYTLTGSVPRTASMASAGVRVNTDCGCVGTADAALYDIVFQEGASSANSVPNGDFAKGLKGWAIAGLAPLHLGRSDLGIGSMLRIKASPRQSLSADSPRFGVEPGQRFTLTFDARVAPASTGSGYFSLVFWGRSGEVSRERIPFAPASFALGTRTTDASGSFRATFHSPGAELPLGQVRVDARFDGDQQLLPASATGAIFVH